MGRLSKINKLKLLVLSICFLKTNNRRYWVHPINLKRRCSGEYHRIIKLVEKFPEKYFQYFRMSQGQFNFILSKIYKNLLPKRCCRSDIISPKEKLAITLRFLATGASFTDLALRFLMGRSTIEKCIFQTINSINKNLLHIGLPTPTSEVWINNVKEFYQKWNFPNCLSAIDGKHIDMYAPANTGSLCFNYKKRFSIVLMALVDASYKFTFVDIGAYGSNCDSPVFKQSHFGKAFLSHPEALGIPLEMSLPNTNSKLPCMIIGDEAFGLKPNLMTPYSGRNLTFQQRIFNYRLSRARRVAENAFGILVNIWRILQKRLEVKQRSTSIKIVLCCVILHNLIKTEFNQLDARKLVSTRIPALDTVPLQNIPASRAMEIRNTIANWCVNEGTVAFQYKMIN